MSIEVTTQAELDKAIAAHPDKWVTITGTGWFHAACGRVASGSASVVASGSASVRAYDSASVRASGSASVVAYGSASVMASGSASVRAYGSASVVASGSASVRAYDSASVMASGSASVRAYGSASVVASGSASVRAYDSASVRASGSASVRAYGSASVVASGSASVRAYDSASVRAYGSASVRAYDSASVRAYDSASVRAYDSASVRAYDSASVRASRMVSIHNHRPDAKNGPKITGGVVIDVRPPADIHEWLADHHIEPDDDGVVVLFKAVNDAFVSSRDFAYTPGTTPVAPDWDGGENECGGGLHFCGAPWIARARFNPTATRFVACPVQVSDIAYDPSHSMLEKVKAKGCCAPVWECDIDGNPVEVVS